jgi:hypothetical protein
MKWTEKEIENAKEFLKSGFDYEDIGEKLGRSKSSIRNKLNEVGLAFKIFNPDRECRKCVECVIEFEVGRSNPKKFCSNSCATKFNNKLGKTGRQLYKKESGCLNCKKQIGPRGKYCDSKCQHEFNRNKKFELIENGDISLSSIWYKKYLISKFGEKCMECGWCEVNKYSGKIPIELEHIDGNSENNELNNLKLLCPNHHSLTSTYKALNAGNGRHSRRKRYEEGKSY